MIVTYLRSSSYNAWDFCQHKYFLDYTLGFRSPANKSAEKGSITHKALELLARKKLAMQRGESEFKDDELGEFSTVEMMPELAIEVAYKHYTKPGTIYTWEPADYRDCRNWMYIPLNWGNGMFSPLKREVVAPECYFDIVFPQPWAHYEYTLPNGEHVSGQLAIKGTMDLMVKQGKKALEMIDWKTGARRDWATFKEKTFEKLCEDPQLRMYYYAACKLYPEYKDIFVTIFYMKSGGPFPLPYTRDMLPDIEKMIERRFNAIRNNVKPGLVYPSKKCEWCHFSKNSFAGPTTNYRDSICQTVHKEIKTLGIDRVMQKHCVDNSCSSYGQGGGRSNAKTE